MGRNKLPKGHLKQPVVIMVAEKYIKKAQIEANKISEKYDYLLKLSTFKKKKYDSE